MTLPNNENVNISDAERLFAKMKSYIGPSILVFFLYLIFYFPGLIANYIYRKEAKRMEKIAGQKLPGTGCLGVMFWLNILNIPLVVITIILILLYALGKTIYKQFATSAAFKEFVKTIALIGFIALFGYSLSIIWENVYYTYILGSDGSALSAYRSNAIFEILGFAITSILSIGILFLGIWKNGWINALWTTLKSIFSNFIYGLSEVWQFINANDQEIKINPESRNV